MALAIEEEIGLDEREQLLLKLLAIRRGVDPLDLIRKLIADSLEQADRLEHLTVRLKGDEADPKVTAAATGSLTIAAPQINGLVWDDAAIANTNWEDEDLDPVLYKMQARTVGID